MVVHGKLTKLASYYLALPLLAGITAGLVCGVGIATAVHDDQIVVQYEKRKEMQGWSYLISARESSGKSLSYVQSNDAYLKKEKPVYEWRVKENRQEVDSIYMLGMGLGGLLGVGYAVSKKKSLDKKISEWGFY